MNVVVRAALLLAQLIIAGFYAWSAMLMWSPFMAAPLANKLFVATIVLWPVVGLAIASRGTQFISLGVTTALALLTVVQVLIVLVFVMSA